MKWNSILALFCTLLFGAGIAITWWLNSGYGTVNKRTYELSKAIYGACLAKSEERLSKIESMLQDDQALEANETENVSSAKSAMPSHERKWLASIIKLARDGHWESAARKSRRIMLDQVRNQ